jgi:hypothetical protein
MSGTRWPDDREVGWRYVRSAPCIRRHGARVSWFSLKTKVNGFSWFGLKTAAYGSCGLASKPLAQVFQFGPQNWQLRYGDLAHKITMTVSWFVPQNQVGGSLSVCASKLMTGWRWCEEMCWHPVACFVAKQVGLGFPSFASKLAVTEGGACGIIVEVTWKWNKRWSVHWHLVRHSESRIKLPFIRCNFSFSPQGYSSLLFLL